jgi:hypothetical protein
VQLTTPAQGQQNVLPIGIAFTHYRPATDQYGFATWDSEPVPVAVLADATKAAH